MFAFIVYLLFIGLVAGFLARLLVPGPDPLSIVGTIFLGAIGSFIGGFLGYVLSSSDINATAVRPSGLVGSVIGAVIALLVYRATTGRGRRMGRLGRI